MTRNPEPDELGKLVREGYAYAEKINNRYNMPLYELDINKLEQEYRETERDVDYIRGRMFQYLREW